ncbi:hypothetical protein LXA43DRAFT_1068854 [Ganoderma leucocontextum]|nr:hypothetical protein LXA43DRAFT_1068854 [Ganoderma leucocontextum]
MHSSNHPRASFTSGAHGSSTEVFHTLRPLKDRIVVGGTIFTTGLRFHIQDVTHEYTSGARGGSGRGDKGPVDQLHDQTPLTHDSTGIGSRPGHSTSPPTSTAVAPLQPNPDPPTSQGTPSGAAKAPLPVTTTSQATASAGASTRPKISYAAATATKPWPPTTETSVGGPAKGHSSVAAISGVQATVGGMASSVSENAPQTEPSMQPTSPENLTPRMGFSARRKAMLEEASKRQLSDQPTNSGSMNGRIRHYAIVLAKNDEGVTVAATATFGESDTLPDTLPQESTKYWIPINAKLEEGMIAGPITIINNSRKRKWVNVRQNFKFRWDDRVELNFTFFKVEMRNESYSQEHVDLIKQAIKQSVLEGGPEAGTSAGGQSKARDAKSG